MDNKDIRGELDLMLAEAELKNLRRKKDRPWSWNRQVLAGCAAVLLVVAGFGGWCFARNHYRAKAQAALPPPVAAPVVKPEQKMPVRAAVPKTAAIQKQQAKDTIEETKIMAASDSRPDSNDAGRTCLCPRNSDTCYGC